MSFFDEQLIQARKNAIKEKYNSFDTGMYAGDKLLVFNKKVLFDNKLSIYLPINFTDMPEIWKQRKYPYEKKPQLIYTDESGSVNFCFSLLKPDVNPINLQAILDGFQILLKKVNPSYLFLDNGSLESENQESVWCEVSGQTIDGKIYFILFLHEVNKKLLLGTFCCPYEEKNIWNYIAFKIIKSICVEVQNESK